MNQYFCKDSLVFSTHKKKFSFYPSQNISFKPSTFSPSSFLKELEEISPKSIELYGEIKNFENITNSLLSANIQEITSEDEVTFLQITATPQLIESILQTYSEQWIENYNDLNEFFIKKQRELEALTHSIEKEKKHLEIQITEIENNIAVLYNKKKEKEKQLEQRITLLQHEYKALEKQLEIALHTEKELHSSKEKIKQLEQKQQHFEHKIKELELEIEVIKTKIKTLQKEKQMGVERQIRPLLLLATLGAGYWTKYSTTEYMIKHLEYSIYKIKEQIATFKKKKFLLEETLQLEQQNLKENETQKSKKIEEIMTKQEKQKKILAEEEDKISKKKKEIIDPIIKKINHEEHTKNQLEEAKLLLEANLKELEIEEFNKCKTKIKELLEEQKKALKELKTFKKKISSQKIPSSKEGKITI
jgi:chromosome segregation ATPase